MAVHLERLGRSWRLTERVEIPLAVDEVFPFFADATNLDRLTPPDLRFRILTPTPIEMRLGALIDYRIRIRGVPVPWRTRISRWEPGVGFTDEQIRGPYRWWIHRHDFADRSGSTVMTDTVEYGVPGGAAVHALLVRRDVERIFTYRTRRLGELFGASPLDAPAVSSPCSTRSGSTARPACS